MMLYVYLTPIFISFIYTSLHFYAFFGTNLLTRCYSVSSFFTIFVFQKNYTENILEIGRNKTQSSFFTVTKTEPKEETEKRHEMATPGLGAGSPLAVPMSGVSPSGTHRPHSSAHICI